MATYEWNNGSITVSKSVTVDGAFEDSVEVSAEITQPANSILSKILIRVVEKGLSNGNANWGYKIGTASDDDVFAIDADGYDAAGTGPVAGVVLNPTLTSYTSATAGTAAVGYSSTERTIYCVNTCSNPTSVTEPGKVEFTLFFDILNKD